MLPSFMCCMYVAATEGGSVEETQHPTSSLMLPATSSSRPLASMESIAAMIFFRLLPPNKGSDTSVCTESHCRGQIYERDSSPRQITVQSSVEASLPLPDKWTGCCGGASGIRCKHRRFLLSWFIMHPSSSVKQRTLRVCLPVSILCFDRGFSHDIRCSRSELLFLVTSPLQQ